MITLRELWGKLGRRVEGCTGVWKPPATAQGLLAAV